ncbi:MAG: TIGR02302 family protein [Rhodobacteraceae bacterium]|nr:MAG: TIGR02302 family protein [Paracoccaceae bacterium]
MSFLRRWFDGAAAAPPTAEERLALAKAKVAREAAKARRRMAVERATRALWPLWTLVALFLGLALLGLPQRLGFAAHVALLAAFAVSAAALGWRAARVWRTPTAAEAAARLDAALPDRPVAALGDALTANAGDDAARRLWAAHQARMAERAAAARAPAADLRVSAEDRFALRHAALLALCAGLIAQVADGGARLADALAPASAAAALAVAPQGPTMEAWASPPAYTRMAPLYLTERDGEAFALPENTEIVVRVFDAGAEPALSGAAVGDAVFDEQGGGAWSATVRLRDAGEIEATAGRATLGAWRFDVIPDEPPTIAYTEGPSRARTGVLQFGYLATDDYGVVGARAEAALDDSADPPFPGLAPDSVIEAPSVELPLPLSRDARRVAETTTQDLTAHPWAGLPVTLEIVAVDGAGQEARDTTSLVLPERRFRDPLARALIEQRRHLAWSIDAAERVVDVLDAVTAHPEDAFEDARVYLMVRTARRRLGYALEDDRVPDEAASVIDLLWEAALRLEDGDLTSAERRLRDLQAELRDAIEQGAPDDEIAQLMQELRAALQEYLSQLAQQMQRDMETGEAPPPQDFDPDQMLTEQDLMDMLDQIEQALRSGMEEMARQMLQQLQQMLENLQTAQPGQQPGGGQGDQAMQQLQDMIGRQQGLADRSFDALRRGRQGNGGRGEGQQRGEGQPGDGGPGTGEPGLGDPGGLGGLAQEQEQLRRMLDDLRRGMPGSGALDRAEEQMGSARDALEQGDADGALQDQVDALDALREGAQELARQQQGQPGQAQQAGRDGRGGDTADADPFGRPRATDGPMDGDSVRVPDAWAMRRARELMDEIRRRAGDRTRPPIELEYLDRLMERF